jgi:hypothetical protein
MDSIKVEVGDGCLVIDKQNLRFIIYNGGEAEIQDMSVTPHWRVTSLGNLTDADRFLAELAKFLDRITVRIVDLHGQTEENVRSTLNALEKRCQNLSH